ncbi:uncharacterized protein LOC117169111 [Belonocnema kinseyi]|uniref:uncharacterized protein LOC117169111 n=1 Tax=Belonocnema kinseyi TaxID=2817044 RepID=UPI00143CFF50|nr:uncharacterized protein LOC117169111 [Belonocnema kinseyi]XP_033211161.1 uncharacterized protein LOC117169111 [Belonocnema kinseyi]
MFRHIFNTCFNLSFKPQHSDTCKTCDNFQCILKGTSVSEDIKEETLRKKEEHSNLVERVNAEFKEDVRRATEREDAMVLTFDLQKTLPTPIHSSNIVYYKRQLWTFNLCIYDEVSKTAYMYVWKESIASRGDLEIGSCLLRHLQENLNPNISTMKLYSDSCGGQNKNIKVCART